MADYRHVTSVGISMKDGWRVIAPVEHPMYNTVVPAGDVIDGVRMGGFILTSLNGVVACLADGAAVTPRGDGLASAEQDTGLPGLDDKRRCDDAEPELDARVLAIRRDRADRRFRGFRDASGEFTESPWEAWPVKGPRTVRWCCDFIAEQNGNPRARHTKWKQECDVKLDDEGVREHELAMRVLEMAATYDQLNVTELSSFELLLRSAQLAELRHKQKVIERRGDASHGDDEHLFLGIGETRGLCMVAPDLETYVASEMAKESSVMKERRKLKEEREHLAPKKTQPDRNRPNRPDRPPKDPNQPDKGKGKGKDKEGQPAGDHR